MKLAPLKPPRDLSVTSATSKAKALNKAFKSVFTIEDLATLFAISSYQIQCIKLYILPSLVSINILSQLDPHKAEGPDGIPALVLKELAFDLAPIDTHPFISAIAKYWCIAQRMEISLHYTPVFKKGQEI